jgi:XTP/dITP diphosphohydrolase
MALDKTNKKFIRRFQFIESMAEADDKLLHDMTLEEMDQLWNKAKEQERL